MFLHEISRFNGPYGCRINQHIEGCLKVQSSRNPPRTRDFPQELFLRHEQSEERLRCGEAVQGLQPLGWFNRHGPESQPSKVEGIFVGFSNSKKGRSTYDFQGRVINHSLKERWDDHGQFKEFWLWHIWYHWRLLMIDLQCWMIWMTQQYSKL